jgi:hypothetical protein
MASKYKGDSVAPEPPREGDEIRYRDLMGTRETRPAQDIHRCTGTLLFARANSKNAALIFG